MKGNSSDKSELLRIQPIEIRLRRRAECPQPLCFRTVCAVNAQTCLNCYNKSYCTSPKGAKTKQHFRKSGGKYIECLYATHYIYKKRKKPETDGDGENPAYKFLIIIF